jgi:hypothetical protein
LREQPSLTLGRTTCAYSRCSWHLQDRAPRVHAGKKQIYPRGPGQEVAGTVVEARNASDDPRAIEPHTQQMTRSGCSKVGQIPYGLIGTPRTRMATTSRSSHGEPCRDSPLSSSGCAGGAHESVMGADERGPLRCRLGTPAPSRSSRTRVAVRRLLCESYGEAQHLLSAHRGQTWNDWNSTAMAQPAAMPAKPAMLRRKSSGSNAVPSPLM